MKRLAVLALLAAGCGGAKAFTVHDVRACVPPKAYADVFVSTEEGVTSLNYRYENGDEADVSVFASPAAALAAEKQEARLGDAHDRRRANVLYSGGGPSRPRSRTVSVEGGSRARRRNAGPSLGSGRALLEQVLIGVVRR